MSEDRWNTDVMESLRLDFIRKWGLDQGASAKLRELQSEDLQIVLREFRADQSTRNVNAKFFAFIKNKCGRSLHGMRPPNMKAPDGMDYSSGFALGSMGGLADEKATRAFGAQWGVDERSLQYVMNLAPDVRAAVIQGFSPPSNTNNVSAKLVQFAKLKAEEINRFGSSNAMIALAQAQEQAQLVAMQQAQQAYYLDPANQQHIQMQLLQEQEMAYAEAAQMELLKEEEEAQKRAMETAQANAVEEAKAMAQAIEKDMQEQAMRQAEEAELHRAASEKAAEMMRLTEALGRRPTGAADQGEKEMEEKAKELLKAMHDAQAVQAARTADSLSLIPSVAEQRDNGPPEEQEELRYDNGHGPFTFEQFMDFYGPENVFKVWNISPLHDIKKKDGVGNAMSGRGDLPASNHAGGSTGHSIGRGVGSGMEATSLEGMSANDALRLSVHLLLNADLSKLQSSVGGDELLQVFTRLKSMEGVRVEEDVSTQLPALTDTKSKTPLINIGTRGSTVAPAVVMHQFSFSDAKMVGRLRCTSVQWWSWGMDHDIWRSLVYSRWPGTKVLGNQGLDTGDFLSYYRNRALMEPTGNLRGQVSRLAAEHELASIATLSYYSSYALLVQLADTRGEIFSQVVDMRLIDLGGAGTMIEGRNDAASGFSRSVQDLKLKLRLSLTAIQRSEVESSGSCKYICLCHEAQGPEENGPYNELTFSFRAHVPMSAQGFFPCQYRYKCKLCELQKASGIMRGFDRLKIWCEHDDRQDTDSKNSRIGCLAALWLADDGGELTAKPANTVHA